MYNYNDEEKKLRNKVAAIVLTVYMALLILVCLIFG